MSEQQGRVSREIRGSLFLIGLDRAAKRNAFVKTGLLSSNEYSRNFFKFSIVEEQSNLSNNNSF